MTSPAYESAKHDLAAALYATRAWAEWKYGGKALQMSSTYRQALRDLIGSRANENETRDRIMALLLLFALWAYQEGLQEAGADGAQVIQAQGQINATVQAWTSQQATFASGLATAIVQYQALTTIPQGAPIPPNIQATIPATVLQTAPTANVTTSYSGGLSSLNNVKNDVPLMTDAIQADALTKLDARIDYWGEALAALKVKGMAAGAELGGQDEPSFWKLGKTEHHCTSEGATIGCLELSQMGTLPLSEFVTNGWIPRSPGNEQITCKGYRCDCELISAASGKKIM